MKRLAFLTLLLSLLGPAGSNLLAEEGADKGADTESHAAAVKKTPPESKDDTELKSTDDTEKEHSNEGSDEIVINAEGGTWHHSASENSDEEEGEIKKGQHFVLKDPKLYNGFYKIEHEGRTQFVKATDCVKVKASRIAPSDDGTEGDGKDKKRSPTVVPSKVDKDEATEETTVVATKQATAKRTFTPTILPTKLPTLIPTKTPTLKPSPLPTEIPTELPTLVPTKIPTLKPTLIPTELPTAVPTILPTLIPTLVPTLRPTLRPTLVPTDIPTDIPTAVPTRRPTLKPTAIPTDIPSEVPTSIPTKIPTWKATLVPTDIPTQWPTPIPTATRYPTRIPTASPTFTPRPTPVPIVPVSVAHARRRQVTGTVSRHEQSNRSSGLSQTYWQTSQSTGLQLPDRNPSKLTEISLYMPFGIGKHLGTVQPAFKPSPDVSDVRYIESSAFFGLGAELRLPAPWLRVSGDWTYFTHRTKAADQNKLATKVGLPAPVNAVFADSDVYYQMNTHAFRLGLKASLPNPYIEPWINGTLGAYVWSAEYLSAGRDFTYGVDTGLALGATVGTGLDFHFPQSYGVITVTPFLEWGAPVVHPKIDNIADIGQTWNDTLGTIVAPESRFGIQLSIGY